MRQERFEVREGVEDSQGRRWAIYDIVTATWGARRYVHRTTAETYLDHLTAGRREVIAAWIIGTNAPGEIRGGSKAGVQWRAQHELRTVS